MKDLTHPSAISDDSVISPDDANECVRQLAPGDLFAGYRIESLVGRGWMGLVYKARESRPERTVAVKILSPQLAADKHFRARFEREASLAAQLEHPNVIPIYAVGAEAGQLYIAMRFIQSMDLGHYLQRHGRLEARHATRFIGQIAAALDAAHASGLVHRDIKPANVLVTGADHNEHLYLTDFGVTKRVGDVDTGLTATGGFVGTVNYVAPEQISGGPIDARADVYALGCVFYELLTGVIPFPLGHTVAKINAHLTTPPPLPSHIVSDLPTEFDAIIARAMAKDPADRFHSAGALARAAAAAGASLLDDAVERAVPTAVDPPRSGTPTDVNIAGKNIFRDTSIHVTGDFHG